MKKLTDGRRTTDAKWWQYLTWSFGSGELKMDLHVKKKQRRISFWSKSQKLRNSTFAVPLDLLKIVCMCSMISAAQLVCPLHRSLDTRIVCGIAYEQTPTSISIRHHFYSVHLLLWKECLLLVTFSPEVNKQQVLTQWPLNRYLIHPNNTFVYLVQCNNPIDCLHQAKP